MRLNTVGLIVMVLLGLLLAPLLSAAQQAGKVLRIGYLTLARADSQHSQYFREVVWQGLREFGWVDGQNLIIEWRYAEERAERYPDLVAELVRLKVDVIVAEDTPAIYAATQATTTIPIVILAVVDPVGAGLVASLARPGGNITGVSGMVPELSGKLLELLKEAVPRVSRVAVLWNPDARGAAGWFHEVKRAAQTLGAELQSLEVRGPDEFESAFEAATREGADALLMLPAVLFAQNERRLAALAVKSRMPAIFWRRQFAAAGGFMAYGPSLPDMRRRAAALVDKILKGAKPGDLPVEQPMKYHLAINLKTAKALGITIPPHLLVLADEVLQ